MDIQQLTQKLSNSADGIQSGTEGAISRLFLSPSPTYSDVSNAAAGTAVLAAAHASGDSYSQCNSYSSAKEEKMVVERKAFCIEKQMEYHKYILSFDIFDEGEKKQAKADLMKLVKEINVLNK
jgi:hypothetical protein